MLLPYPFVSLTLVRIETIFFVVVFQSPNHVWLFVTATHQATLSLIISWSLPKFMFMALLMPSSHLILWCLLLLPSVFPSIRDFPMSQLFPSDDQNIGVSSVLPVNVEGWSPLRLTFLISLLFKGLLGVFSSTTAQRHQFFGILPSLWSSSHNHKMTTGKTIALIVQTFVGRVMSLLFNIPAKKQTSDFMAAVTNRSDFRAQEEEILHYFHIFSLYLLWSNGSGCHDLNFSFKLALSLSSFTLIKRLFSSSSLSAIRVVSSAYLRFCITREASKLSSNFFELLKIKEQQRRLLSGKYL